MATLYKLTEEYLELLDLLEDDSVDQEVLNDTLEEVGGEIEVKADNCAKLIQELNGSVNILDTEIDRLKKRRETIARERQKYADYDDLKEKASKYDEYQAQNKTELQKEKEKSDALQAKLSALEKKDTVRQVREKTAKDTGVPVELLTGEDEETCKKQAEAIMKFAKPKKHARI